MSDTPTLETKTSRWIRIAIAGLFVAGLFACADESGEPNAAADFADMELHQNYSDSVDGPHADHRRVESIALYDAAAVDRYFDEDGVAQFEYPDAFQQVGLRLDAASVDDLSYRVQREDGQWSDWRAVDVYWSEATMHNAHVVLDAPTNVVEFRGGDQITFAKIEFFPDVVARDHIGGVEQPDSMHDGAHQDVAPQQGSDIDTTRQAVAPGSLVTSRHQWGAAAPDKVCGSVVDPWRASIHHTAVPDSDGGDPHARMRGMQSYHMNTLGWCDIGYHFVVAQSGEIMQGRSRSNRPAAHVGGQNSGNVGISLIGNYSSATPPNIQVKNAGEILNWVHETHGVPLNRDAVRGHREWPGQTTGCPGNQGLAQIDDIIARADSAGEPDFSAYGVDLEVSVDGLDNFYQQGTSDQVPDAFAGDTFTAELVMTNTSEEPIRDVALGYGFGPGVEATTYRIETDHPAHDKSSWTLNDANDEPSNPDPGAMGSEGSLEMYAFSPGESKRVVVELEATQYNIGAGHRPGVRAWLRNVRNVYGGGTSSYGSEPDTNHLGEVVREFQRVDVLSPDEWLFQAGHRDDLEGWTGEQAYDDLALNTGDDALALLTNDAGASVLSPQWTSIDADAYDDLVLRARSHDGSHHKVLYWTRAGEDFDEARSVRFSSPGDGDYHTQVIPLGSHPEWSGEIDRLRLVHPDDLVPGEEDSGWYDIDWMYFQNAAAGITSSQTLGVVDEAPVSITFDAGAGATERVDVIDVDWGGDADGGEAEDADNVVGDDNAGDGAEMLETNSGCSAAGQSSGPPALWLLVLVVAAAMLMRPDPEPQADA